jgi:hypothetical protein
VQCPCCGQRDDGTLGGRRLPLCVLRWGRSCSDHTARRSEPPPSLTVVTSHEVRFGRPQLGGRRDDRTPEAGGCLPMNTDDGSILNSRASGSWSSPSLGLGFSGIAWEAAVGFSPTYAGGRTLHSYTSDHTARSSVPPPRSSHVASRGKSIATIWLGIQTTKNPRLGLSMHPPTSPPLSD